MSHGIVVCPNFEFSGQNVNFNCFLDEIEIRRNLLYWDNIAYAFPNGFGKPNLDVMTDLKYLHDQKLLTLEDISVSTEEIGKQHIQRRETNTIVTPGPSTPDNLSGLLVLGWPATIWGDFCQFAQIKVAELKQSSNTNTWTIGQSGAQLSLPSGKDKANLIEARIHSGLPVPSADTPLNEILEFKEKRAEELIRFRHLVDQLYISLLSSPDQERELRIAVEKIDLALIDLYQCLNENKIKTFFGTLHLYMNIENPTLFCTLVGWLMADAAEFPLSVGVAAGLAVKTLLTFGSRCIEKPTTIPTDLKNFMYVYEVTKQWPVKQI